MMRTNAIRQRIRDEREKKGITQEEMADRLFIDRRTYTRIESGEKKLLDISLIEKLAKELDLDLTELLAEENSVNIESINNSTGIASGVFTKEVTINNADKNMQQLYESTIAELKTLLAEKNATIALLQQMLQQKKD